MADTQLAAVLAQQASILEGVQRTLEKLEEREKDTASSLAAMNSRITADIANDKATHDTTLASEFPQCHPLGYGSPRILLLLNLAYNASAMVHLI